MANIPVEKTGAGSIWPWLIGLLALVLVGWLAVELFDDEPDADEVAGLEDNVGPIDDAELDDPGLNDDAALVITTIEPLYLVDLDPPYEERDALVGHPVSLAEARVLSTAGDSAFWVGTDADRRVLVVLENLGEDENPNTALVGSDGRLNVDAGDIVRLDGTVTRSEEGTRGTYTLEDADRERLLQQGFYVRVDSPDDIAVSEGEAGLEEDTTGGAPNL